MKTEHTPGPWTPKKRFRAYKFFAPHNYLIPIEHPTSGYVAYASANKFDSDSKANARLIAGAPVMLEALVNVERTLREDMAQDDTLGGCLMVIQLAIAQAKGEQSEPKLETYDSPTHPLPWTVKTEK